MDDTSPPGAPARLVIVDDHDYIRHSIKDMLDGEPDMSIVGEASDGEIAVEVCRRERPDLVLMDVRMPRLDGLQATRRLKEEAARTSVLMVTMHEDPDYMLQALRAGAAGYILKDATREEMLLAIRSVLDGGSPLDPELATRLLRRLAEDTGEMPTGTPAGNPHAPGELIQPLTPREVEVLTLLARGWTNRQIAEEFVVSAGTVKRHVENLIAKLGASDRTQAVVKALRFGIITFPDR